METKKLSTRTVRRSINWTGAIFLTLTPILAVVLTGIHLYFEGFVWQIWALAAVFYTLSASAITGGYHRCFAHKTYDAKPWLKWFWALWGAAAFQNSIQIWARDHRMHHRFVDTDLDPYSINRGFWFAHFGWMMYQEELTPQHLAYGRDLERDPVVAFQHKHYVLIASFMSFVLPLMIGALMGSWLGGLAVAGLLRMVTLHHATFFINSACHYWGGRTYTDSNSARDSFIMALATFGEGYHNFHHYFANDYRNGVRWYHWDPTKWAIQIFHLLGGAENLRRTPQSEILKAQLEMDEKKLKSRLDSQWQVQFQTQIDNLKAQVEAAHQRFEQLREEYKKIVANYADMSMARLQELKEQLRLAKAEAREAWRAWKEYQSLLLSGAAASPA